jgi:hypothetical protein
MVSQVIGLAFGALLAVSSPLNLTPLPHQTPLEGGFRDDTAFNDGENIVTYTPPGRWSISGDAGKAVLRPKEVAEAEAAISKLPLPAVTAFNEETVKGLKAEAAAALPGGATKVEWGEDQENPVTLNQHPTYRIQVAYTAYSQRFVRTILFCNFASEQIRFQLTCRESDFKDLYEQFRQSVFSFRGLK